MTSAHMDNSGLRRDSVGTVYPYGVVSRGSLAYSVDYRKPIPEQMKGWTHGSVRTALRRSALRRIMEYLGTDRDGQVTFVIDTRKPAGSEFDFYDYVGGEIGKCWEHAHGAPSSAVNPERAFQIAEAESIEMADAIEDGVKYQLVHISAGVKSRWVLWRALDE